MKVQIKELKQCPTEIERGHSEAQEKIKWLRANLEEKRKGQATTPSKARPSIGPQAETSPRGASSTMREA